MNRGDRREAIFVDDRDQRLFMETLDEACQKTDWQLHAWCLMRKTMKPQPLRILFLRSTFVLGGGR